MSTRNIAVPALPTSLPLPTFHPSYSANEPILPVAPEDKLGSNSGTGRTRPQKAKRSWAFTMPRLACTSIALVTDAVDGGRYGAGTCNKYASLEMYISSGVLLQLCSGIHGRLFKLAHGDNGHFHVMVFPGMVGTAFSKQFLLGTPKQVFHASTQGNFQAPILAQPILQPRMQLCRYFSQLPLPIKFSKHFFQPSPPPPFPSTDPSPAHRQPRMNLAGTFPNHPSPSKFSKHFFQAAGAFGFPSGVLHQMSEDFFFRPMQLSGPRLELHLAIYNQQSKRFSGIVKVQKYFMPRGFATCGVLVVL